MAGTGEDGGVGDRRGQRCRGQSPLQPCRRRPPALLGPPNRGRRGHRDPRPRPRSTGGTWGRAGTGSATTRVPRKCPDPPCRRLAVPWRCRAGSRRLSAALRLRCQPGARLLFPQTAAALVAHDFFMPGWLCPRRGVPWPPEPRHPSRGRPPAVTDPRNGAGSAFGPQCGPNKWVRVLGGPGGPWVAGWPRGSRWVPAGTCPAAQPGAAFIHPGPPRPPRRGQVPLGGGGGAGRCPTATACP